LVNEVKANVKEISAGAVIIAGLEGGTHAPMETTVGAAVSACQSKGLTKIRTGIKVCIRW